MTTRTRKRRRPPASDWQLPVLTDLGFQPKQQKLLVIIASIAGVLAAAVGLTLVVTSLGSGYAPERQATAAMLDAGTTLPEVFHGWASPKGLEPIGDRAKDTKPLTEKEVFAQKTLTGGKKLTLKLGGTKLDTDCTAALWGAELLDELDGCTQAARAAYTSADGRYVAQYTLLNLQNVKAAGDFVESLKTLYRGGWVRPLPEAAFPAGGHSEGGAYALGHYVGLVWIGRADGAEPTPKDDFVSLTLTLRGAEKAVYRRTVDIAGPSS
ncbi:hypothetical protein [Nonomuraea sediminis]|uniref:hypothetical protein n=1 Tax=Nonomuraea sediminis TaxID=2835864 RepID=UPI001BDCF1E8|nr:hypothetical protein [Nonomuraea sediminis]